MSQSPATSIFYYDVVILGGGIAGIAIAELLSRRTALSIKVIEEAPQLGMGASGKLEGWFHSGALYSGNDDPQTFLNCLNALEDLINYYSTFFPEQCNMVLANGDSAVFLPTVRVSESVWFNNTPIYCILPNEASPDIRRSRLKNDPVFLEIQRQRVLGRIHATFGGRHNWLQNGKCLAPTLETIEKRHETELPVEEPPDSLRRLTKRFDASYNLPDSGSTLLKSSDVTLNSAKIMRDLVSSALSRGVNFETSVKTDSMAIERYGPLRIKSILGYSGDGRRMNLRAKIFIFAVGSAFDRHLTDLNLRVRLRTNRSSMLVSYPPVCSVNFARMSINSKFHFNHLIQSAIQGEKPVSYSMLANSAFSAQESPGHPDFADVDALLETAERYFGDGLYARRLFSYDCVKTEFITDEEEKRRYSYWIESPAQGNFICVLPGKFSFFPTVAHQTHLRVKEMLDFKDSTEPRQFSPDKADCQKAQQLVADHYPLRILGQDVEDIAGE